MCVPSILFTGIFPFDDTILDSSSFLEYFTEVYKDQDNIILDLPSPPLSTRSFNSPTVTTSMNEPGPSNVGNEASEAPLVTPTELFGYPIVPAAKEKVCKNNSAGEPSRRRGTSKIMTSTPEIMKKRALHAERKQKKELQTERKLKRALKVEKKVEDLKGGKLRKKKRSLPSKQKKVCRNLFSHAKQTEDGSESNIDGDLMSLADSSSEETFSDLEQPDAMDALETDPKKITVDDFALVRIECEEKSDIKLYVGKVMEIVSPTTFKMKFLRRNFRSGRSFTFPEIDDISDVDVKNIIHKLSLSENIRGTARQQRHFNFGIDFPATVD